MTIRICKTITLFILFVFSCKEDDSLEKRINNISIHFKVERFDTLFSQATSKNLKYLKAGYPFMFSEAYSDDFWLKKKSDTLQVALHREVYEVFKDFDATRSDIDMLFKHLKYYISGFEAPRVITTTSDVDYANKVIVTDSIAVIALDTYLGENHKFYDGIPRYLTSCFKKSQIVVDLAEAYGKKMIRPSQRRMFLDHIIYFGKLLYLKDILIPFKSEFERIGYTEEQLKWAIANENYIWRYFISKSLLFSTDTKLLNRFVNPAPFSKFYLEGIDRESPGRLGQYIGLQIVRSYMKNNNVTFEDMLTKKAEDIFKNAKFKPRKS